jgi:hypothetical protein
MSIVSREESLARAWAWVLEHISNTWLYNCDSDDSHSFCNRDAYEEGPWTVIYQPAAVGYCRMLECDELVGNIIIRRKDGRPITVGGWRKAQSCIQEVNKLYLQSYNDILDMTDGKWIESSNGTIRSLLHTKKDLCLEDGILKYKFRIQPRGDHCCGVGWLPRRVVTYRCGETCEPLLDLEVFDTPARRAVL